VRELALFAGAGGGILGGTLLGWRTVCAVERDAYAAAILAQRQNDGCLEPFPIWSDVETFDGRPWQGCVDVVSGGFPCQDISQAGKGVGITGKRSGLWSEMARIVSEIRPRYVWVENSPLLVGRGLGLVLADLASMGFSARWGIVGAHHLAARHRRNRIWILAANGHVADADMSSATRQREHSPLHPYDAPNRKPRAGMSGERSPWASEPALGRVADGVAYRVDKFRAIGNGQVPVVAALAWGLLAQD